LDIRRLFCCTSSWFVNLSEYVSILVLTAQFLLYYQHGCFCRILIFNSTTILWVLPFHNNQNPWKNVKSTNLQLSFTLTAWGENIVLFASWSNQNVESWLSQQDRHFYGTKTSFHAFVKSQEMTTSHVLIWPPHSCLRYVISFACNVHFGNTLLLRSLLLINLACRSIKSLSVYLTK